MEPAVEARSSGLQTSHWSLVAVSTFAQVDQHMIVTNSDFFTYDKAREIAQLAEREQKIKCVVTDGPILQSTEIAFAPCIFQL